MRSITRLLCDSRATCYHSALRPTTCWNVTSARDSKPRPGPVPRPLPEMWITSHFNFFGQICRKNLMPWFQNHCLPVMKVLLTIGGYCFFWLRHLCGSVRPRRWYNLRQVKTTMFQFRGRVHLCLAPQTFLLIDWFSISVWKSGNLDLSPFNLKFRNLNYFSVFCWWFIRSHWTTYRPMYKCAVWSLRERINCDSSSSSRVVQARLDYTIDVTRRSSTFLPRQPGYTNYRRIVTLPPAKTNHNRTTSWD